MKQFLLLAGVCVGQCLSAAETGTAVEGYLSAVEPSALVATLSPTLEARGGQKVGLSAGDVAIGWQGRRIRGTQVESDGKTRLENIFSAEPDECRQANEITDGLRRDSFERGRTVTRGLNELMPNMALWGQDGKFYLKKDFLGAPLVVNFIFTRCRNPKMCPASTQVMKQLSEAMDAHPQLKSVKLLSITFDPTYDSPGVLRMYTDAYQINSQRHVFLTGDKNQIKDLMRHYGILTTEADGTIVHNSATIIVSAEGRMVQRREGSIFNPEEVLATLEGLIERTPQP